MIIQSAILKDGVVYVGRRHHNIINRTTEETKTLPLGFFKYSHGNNQGFVDDEGNYLTRKQAAVHALACGQIKKLKFSTYELYSEDLY